MFTADDNATSRLQHMIANKVIVDLLFFEENENIHPNYITKCVLEYFLRNVLAVTVSFIEAEW